MNARPAEFTLFGGLTPAQQLRVWEIWHDAAEPTEYAYDVQGAQVVGRRLLSDALAEDPAPLPKPVRSAIKEPAPITTQDVMHVMPQPVQRNGRRIKPLTLQQIERELEWPYPGAHRRRKPRGLGAFLIRSLAVALFQIQATRAAQ